MALTLPPPDSRVGAVQHYLGDRPLMEWAEAMVAAADETGIDWRLLPVIGVLESSGGLAACGGLERSHNPFGYASCGVHFPSKEEAVSVSARTLAGYGGDVAWQLCVWNQGATGCRQGLAEGYVQRGLAEMARLGSP